MAHPGHALTLAATRGEEEYPMLLRRSGALALAALGLVAVAPAAAGAHPVKLHPVKQFYVSLGDSYAVGTADPVHTTLNGYPNMLVKLARRRGYDYTLVNFGCGGAAPPAMLTPGP